MSALPEDLLAATLAADHPKIAALADTVAERARAGRPCEREKALLAALVERSRKARAERAARLPRPRFPEELPIAQKRDDIAAVAAHPVTIVCGETGVKTPADLRGKNIGISRVGSASDVAAQVFLRALGLEPNKDVAILQVGGATERAAAFNSGRISGFPSSPGAAYLAKGVRHKVMMTLNDLPSRYEFPNLCVTVTQSYLQTNRDAVRRAIMAIVEGVHYFKNNKADSKNLMAKYSRQTHDDYLESSYIGHAKLFERIPLVGREGLETQIKAATARKPGAALRAEDIADNSIVQELIKNGFIDRLYKNVPARRE